MAEPYYNNGVGHGAFVATFGTAGSVTLENFNVDVPSSHIIDVPTSIGAAQDKWAGVSGGKTASALAQLPVTAGTVTLIALGDSFTAPSTHGGLTWIVIGASSAFQVGDYWKANISLKKSG